MSVLSQTPPKTNGHSDVRVYRGRTVTELIPKIRAELGPDAVILREREGLLGGMNGFFAKRFIEVEAQAATGRLDTYDDQDPEPGEEETVETWNGESAARGGVEDPAPAARRRVEDPESTQAEESKPVRRAAAKPPARNSAKPAARRRKTAAKPAARKPAPETAPEASPQVEPTPALSSFAAELASAQTSTVSDGPGTPETGSADRGPVWHPNGAGPREPVTAPEPTSRAATQEPNEAPTETATEAATEAANEAATKAVPEPVPEAVPAVPAPRAAAPSPRPRRLPRVRVSAKTAKSSKTARSAKNANLDTAACAAVAAELTACGFSQSRAARLIVEATTHCIPLCSPGDVRGAVRLALANRIPVAASLPPSGAAIAFVGAGGAGKTRCTAALATAYRRASTLPVSAISLPGPDRGRSLAELLKPQRIAPKTGAVSRHASDGRRGGLVVLDTPAVAPGDPDSVAKLAAELHELELDGVVAVVPATLGSQAAMQLLNALKPLRPTGIAISHADETDQLGVAVELACMTGIPVAYVHEGLDLGSALSAPGPLGLANRLLP